MSTLQQSKRCDGKAFLIWDRHGFLSTSWKSNEGFLSAKKCALFLCERAFPLSLWCFTPGITVVIITVIIIKGHARLHRYLDLYTSSPREAMVFLHCRHCPLSSPAMDEVRRLASSCCPSVCQTLLALSSSCPLASDHQSSLTSFLILVH